MSAENPGSARPETPVWLEVIPDEALRQIATAWESLSEVQKEIVSASVATFLQANEGRRQQ